MVKEGNKAPDFSGKNQNGKPVKLSSFKGNKNVVLYFYPKDMTPGCTKQACQFKQYYEKFSAKSCTILGISKDSIAQHQKFHLKYKLT